MMNELAFSRPLASVAALGKDATDSHRFEQKVVLLTGDEDVLALENGRLCFTAATLLLARTCKRGIVQLPAGFSELERTCGDSLAALGAADWEVRAGHDGGTMTAADAVLSVGSRGARPSRPVAHTVVNSQGWLARVSTGPQDLARDCDRSNPIAAVAAACLGTAEVFKTLLALNPERGGLLSATTFSLLTYASGGSDPGPALAADIAIDAALCGAGAIGNGTALILSALPISGRLWIVDRQTFGPENLGTCACIEEADIGSPKAQVLTRFLAARRANLQVIPFVGEIQEWRERLQRGGARPQIVLGALDNIDARYDAQDLWPDLLIDGAIGDFPCQVSRHPWPEDVGCVRCLFRPATSNSAHQQASRATGLSEARVQDPDSLVTADDVSAAAEGRREWLKVRVGKPICSVVQEGVAQQLSTSNLSSSFQPSVPFVACMSAAMMVGELVKHAMGLPSPPSPRFQMDILRGPERGELLPQKRRQDCICVSRRRNIERLRADGK